MNSGQITDLAAKHSHASLVVREALRAPPFQDQLRVLVTTLPGIKNLSTRELEILVAACQGYEDKEISLLLNISYSTIRTHWNRILRKQNAYSCREVLARLIFSLSGLSSK